MNKLDLTSKFNPPLKSIPRLRPLKKIIITVRIINVDEAKYDLFLYE